MSMNARSTHVCSLSVALFSTLLLFACTAPQKQPPTGMMDKDTMEKNNAMMDKDDDRTKTATNPSTPQEKITNAMSAGPSAIAKDAAVLDWPTTEGGDFAELRKWTNGLTCLPDYPVSPGNDPMCLDGVWLEWFQAYAMKKDPVVTHTGIAYMLQGGSDASNTDPFAMEPAPGEDWMDAPPHVMVVSPNKSDLKAYGSTMGSAPWIMWENTPYEHLMVPVQ